MFPLSLPWRLLIVGVLLLSAVTAAFIKGIDYQQTKDAAQAAKELQYRDQQLIKGVAQHAEDQSVIAVLSDYANRMSIHPIQAPKCSAGNQDVSAGVFFDTLNKALADLRRDDVESAKQCDNLNIDAKQANTSNK